jgi:hypothetical protein
LPPPIRHNTGPQPTGSNRRSQSQPPRPRSSWPVSGSSRAPSPSGTGHFPPRRISDIAGSANSGSHGIAQSNRDVQHALGNTQSAPARPAAGLHGTAPNPSTRLSGMDTNGRTIRFTPDKVDMVEMRGFNAKVIGISFPTKADDRLTNMEWARAIHRHSDKTYVPNWTSGRHRIAGAERRAPWYNPANPKVPFYVQAHSELDGFAIGVNTASPGRPASYEKVYINGRTHGQLLGTNGFFQTASRADPRRSLVYLSCHAGNPGSRLAADSARTLRNDYGHGGAVHAGTGVVNQIYNAASSHSWVGVAPGVHRGRTIPGEFRSF